MTTVELYQLIVDVSICFSFIAGAIFGLIFWIYAIGRAK